MHFKNICGFGSIELKDIMDTGVIQSMMDDFYHLTKIGVAIVDLKGTVLVATGWQDICTQFHRRHPETLKNCIESDVQLSAGIEPGEFKAYRCKNHMWDIATPIVIGGNHIGNLFLGQFFYEDERPDFEFYRSQAKRYGFDETAYLAALDRVPRWRTETVETVMRFYAQFTGLISNLSFSNLKLAHELRAHESTEKSLKESEEKLRAIFNASPLAMVLLDRDGRVLDSNEVHAERIHMTRDKILGRQIWELLPSEVSGHRKKQVRDVFETGRPFSGEDQRGENWIQYHIHPALLDKNGHVEAVIVEAIDITDRKTAEHRIAETLSWYQEIFEGSKDAIFISDENARFVSVNSAACDLTGYKPDELITMRIPDLYHENKPGDFNTFHARIFGGEPISSEAQIIHKDGHKVYAGFSNKRIIVSGKRFMHTTARDISEKKKQDQELQLRSLILDQIHDHVTITDLDGVISYINQAVETTLGRNRQELIGKSTDIYGEDLPRGASQREIIEKTIRRGAWRGEILNYAADGTEKILDCRTVVIKNQQGKMIAICGVASDITGYKRWEEEQKRLRSQLANAMEMAQLGHWEYSITDDLFTFNDQFYNIFHTSAEREGGYTMPSREYARRFVHPEDRDIVSDEIRKAVDANFPEYSRDIEHRMLYADGKTGFLAVRFFIVKDSHGNTVKTYGVNQDITERKRAAQALQQAQKMESIGTLAGGIAHDFNNILFPIIGHAEMLLEDMPDDTFIQNSLKEIHASALRAKDLVHQILAFARREKSEPKMMRVQPIVKEALKLIRSTIPTTIAITRTIQADCGAVKADPTQIHQIVMNLATNAWHAMAESGGELSLRLKQIELGAHDPATPDMPPGAYACLTVADTGMGMDKEVIEHIFDPFFTTKEKGKGTGMGLSVVHGIVKSMNGAIRVHSEPGKGSEFNVYLPVVEALSQSQEIETHNPALGGKERILLVDDEKAILVLEKKALERIGYQVTACNGSTDALETFRAGPARFDLVITDMSMPHMSGDKLALELIKIRGDIPILMCTGFSDRMTDERIKSLGIRELLIKPIVIKDLAHKIREALDPESRPKIDSGIRPDPAEE